MQILSTTRFINANFPNNNFNSASSGLTGYTPYSRHLSRHLLLEFRTSCNSVILSVAVQHLRGFYLRGSGMESISIRIKLDFVRAITCGDETNFRVSCQVKYNRSYRLRPNPTPSVDSVRRDRIQNPRGSVYEPSRGKDRTTMLLKLFFRTVAAIRQLNRGWRVFDWDLTIWSAALLISKTTTLHFYGNCIFLLI